MSLWPTEASSTGAARPTAVIEGVEVDAAKRAFAATSTIEA